MSKILIQTTITGAEDAWCAQRFTKLADVLRSDGHTVTARNREPQPDGSDAVLSHLAESDFDELWLIAADRGNGLSPADVRGILHFRERGGGILAARDREDLGASLLNLGTIGAVNNFASYNRFRERRRFTRERIAASYATGMHRVPEHRAFRRIVPLEPVHDVLRSGKSPSGVVEYFPAPPHEGSLSVPAGLKHARVIALGANASTGRAQNLAVAIEGEIGGNGRPSGRAVAASSFHYFADPDWAERDGAPHAIEESFNDYIRNLARWLAPARA